MSLQEIDRILLSCLVSSIFTSGLCACMLIRHNVPQPYGKQCSNVNILQYLYIHSSSIYSKFNCEA